MKETMDAQASFGEEQNLGRRGGAVAWLEAWLVRGLLGGVGRLPHPLQRALLGGLARLAMRIDRRHTEAARGYLSAALGAEAAREDARIRRSYRHLFQLSVDSAAFERRVPAADLLGHFEVHLGPGVREAFEGGGGGIVVTPHVGDWEAGSAALAQLVRGPLYALAKPPKNRYLARQILRSREARGVRVMPRRGGMAQAGGILSSGGWIAMLLDQRPRGKSVLAPFFGRVAPCERSAAVLMRRLGVPVIFGACYLTDRPFRYELRLERMLRPEEAARLSLPELVARVNAEQERLILAAPDQYFWLHDRYRGASESPAASSGAVTPPEARESASPGAGGGGSSGSEERP
jgi:KDO2-lipid IV(A) lauroyltransferase